MAAGAGQVELPGAGRPAMHRARAGGVLKPYDLKALRPFSTTLIDRTYLDLSYFSTRC